MREIVKLELSYLTEAISWYYLGRGAGYLAEVSNFNYDHKNWSTDFTEFLTKIEIIRSIC